MVARQLGVKQKSLFDQLLDDRVTLTKLVRGSTDFEQNQKDRRQKTFVISRNSLASINQTAKRENISRDILVEISINRLLPVIANELERHIKRKEIVADMKEHLLQGENILKRAGTILGTNDRISKMLVKQLGLAGENLAKINVLMEQGSALERW